jgi:fumarate hydratase subunit beta
VCYGNKNSIDRDDPLRSNVVSIQTPLTNAAVRSLKAGMAVTISGVVYAARDAAHRRFAELLDRGEALPFDSAGAVIYYVGPTPAPAGRAVGSAGPTTARRMDPFVRRLSALGVRGSIGKGDRAPEVAEALAEHGAVYFAATGGVGALLSRHITASRVIAFEDLGPEAVRELVFADFPAVVAIDCFGNDLFAEGRRRYRTVRG